MNENNWVGLIAIVCIVLAVAACLVVTCLSGCDIIEYESMEYEQPVWITFEEVSQPYFDQYGSPEDVYEYKSADYHSIDWWWWSQGFMVCFVTSTYDNVYGWTVDHTYSFDPIY